MRRVLDNLRNRSQKPKRPSAVEYRGFVLPPPDLRFCGDEFKDDAYFLKSAELEAARLVKHSGLTRDSRVLDVGCGAGRLAIGILAHVGEVAAYRGIDVYKPAIEWCRRYIARKHSSFSFVHFDVANERYNPRGQRLDGSVRLDVADASIDVINLYSVFSHMTYGDVVSYLSELRRVSSPLAKTFLTAFVEEGVPNFAINPPGYRESWSGALHCVRFERGFFESMLGEAGFRVDDFEHGRETNGQSAYYLSPRS